MSETGILGRNVWIRKSVWSAAVPREGVIAGIYSTRKGPSFKVRVLYDGKPQGGGVSLKRNEFELKVPELSERDRFYAEHHDCGHGLLVFFGKGDWIHLSDGSICTQEPEAPR